MLVFGVSPSLPLEGFCKNWIKVRVNPEEHDKRQAYHTDNYWDEAREPKLELAVCTGHENDSNKIAYQKDFQSFLLLVRRVDSESCSVLKVERFSQILQAPRGTFLTNEEVVDVEDDHGDSNPSCHSVSSKIKVMG